MKEKETFRIAAYYTKEYEEFSKILINSLDNLGIPYAIEERKSRGSWWNNIWIIPEYIREMMDKYPEDNIVLVGVDSEFHRYPVEFDHPKFDLAAMYFKQSEANSKSQIMRNYVDDQEDWMLSGIVFFRNTPEIRSLVSKWIEVGTKFRDRFQEGYHGWGYGDQGALEMTIKMHYPKIKIRKLPNVLKQNKEDRMFSIKCGKKNRPKGVK